MTDNIERSKAGRPSKYKPTYCDLLIEHMSDGASLTSFAAEIGVSRDTLTEWVSVHPEFSLAVKKGKAKCAAWWERLGRKNAMTGDGNATLVIFGLKNMAADDWRDKQEVSHSGTVSLSTMTDEELEAIATGRSAGTSAAT